VIARLRASLGGLVRLHGSPRGIAGGFAVGVGLSLIPVPFLGMVIALAAAPLLRLNVPATYLGTAVINPVTGAAFYFGELWLGLWLCGRPLPSWALLSQLDAGGWWALFTSMLAPFLIGAAVAIPVVAGLGYAALYALVRWWRGGGAGGQPPSQPIEPGSA
jgi:uncharacterized protein (DUF2062 family)